MTSRSLNSIALALTLSLFAVGYSQNGQAAEADPEPAVGSLDQQAALGGDPFQALLTKVVRTVEWQRSHTHLWQSAAVNNMLLVGDTLRTGADAKAELLYGDGSVTRVGSLTSLTLAGADRRELHLDSGRVWLHIIKHNAGMKVITPGAVAAVTGTELMVEFDPIRRTTQVTVFEGAVNVSGDIGHLVRVMGGTTTNIPFHAPAAAPIPLDNHKLQERENILRPLALPEDPNAPKSTTGDSGQGKDPIAGSSPAPDASSRPIVGTANATPRPATSAGPVTDPHPEVPSTAPSAAVPTVVTPVAEASTDPVAAAKPVQPDLKGQTEKLLDPRVINGSPTTGGVRVIIR